MYIDTYINSSDKNTLNKDLTDVAKNVSVYLKEDTDQVEPTIILSNTVSQSFNYCYISEFNRYYYVKSRTYSQQRYYVKLKSDPLMSRASNIEDLEVIAERSSSNFNLFQIDEEVPSTNKTLFFAQNFSGGFNGETYILAVTGD